MAGYFVSRHKDTAEAEQWGISYRTAKGSKIAAGTVTLHKHSRYIDVRTDAGEPCTVGSRGYVARRDAVRRFERGGAQAS